METKFRERIQDHIASLPLASAPFSDLRTNPFVLLMFSRKKGYTRVRQIEDDLLQAKVFSSMETSAGKMVEAVALPAYGWEDVPSQMHTAESVLDGKHKAGNVLRLLTLKSGPNTLDDSISESIASAVVDNCVQWANDAGVQEIDFTYGALYGTKKQSNKKDWHILRRIGQKLPDGSMEVPPVKRWDCRFIKQDIKVTVTVRLGTDLWAHIAGHEEAVVELGTAIIRACIPPSDWHHADHSYSFSDLSSIVSLTGVRDDFNVSILQRSQLEWVYFFASHYCDRLTEE